jgi:Mlc titration factor MtfA (ptsG expression regulator)
MAWFLSHTKVVGIGFPVSQTDEHLVAASAIIPIFHFEHWDHYELDEVMLFRGPFNFEFETDSHDSEILGLVGIGEMEGKMALCIEALYDGFLNKADYHNTALHEFIHLLDKADGTVDGLPKKLISYSYALPWLKLIRHKMGQVRNGQTDIDSYAGLSLPEFFAVTSEYFFERPDEFRHNHPELYEHMDDMFRGRKKEMPAA